MKLKNKKTGEIGELYFEPDKEYHFTVVTEDPADMMIFKTLESLTKEWEDYEEAKWYWYIDWTPEIGVYNTRETFPIYDNKLKEIGNYFETKEAAEKAVKKLEAWKRLKDQGTKVEGWLVRSDIDGTMINVGLSFDKMNKGIAKDLDLLFSGEDD